MNWDKQGLEQSWKSFKQHAQFMFDGPLKKKDEEEKCVFLMLWVGEKGIRIFQTWNLTADQKKNLENYYNEMNLNPTLNQLQIPSTTNTSFKVECRITMTHLSNL